ncbi:MAG: N-6 DNA methylase [Gammaproteobacteria bacterium]|nr:N-6 DNA methylase [Gammaproteobacteria bacterium]
MKNNNPSPEKVMDRASGRLITAGPEEVDATQPLLGVLIDECGWEAEQIVSRPRQWRVPSHPSGRRSWPVDIAVFDKAVNARNSDHVVIICECKRPDESSGVDQLKVYLDREPHARVGIWFNGLDHAIVYKTRDGYALAPVGTPIPGPEDPLHPGTRAALLTYPDLRRAPSLVPLFGRIRNRLAARDTNVNRDEEILPDLSSLLLLKILDEQANRLSPRRPLNFQSKDGERNETSQHIRRMLANEVAKHTDVFGATDVRLSIDDASTAYVVVELQNYRLLSNDVDTISTAFQVIRGKAYKGEEGQFFTPPSVVDIAVAAAAPSPDDRVIDPACGSGSFLAAALNTVIEDLKGIVEEDSAEFGVAKRDWSTQNLYAIDKDSVSVRLTKAYLSLLGDGSTHVYRSDSLATDTWSAQLTATIPDGSFSVVLTNPPFGTKLKVSAKTGQREGYLVSRKWTYDEDAQAWKPTELFEDTEVGIVFFERCLRLLEDGGRMAIVLPDTYLFSPSYQWFVYWICTNYTVTHSINVPIEAFEPYCRAKTSIIVLRKEPPRKGHRIRGVLAESCGEDKHGHPLYRLDRSGRETDDLDDEMAEAAVFIRARSRSANHKLKFAFPQSAAASSGVIVASYHWREPYLRALDEFAAKNDCSLVSVGELVDRNELELHSGHGSPKSHFKGKGDTPYIKVSDIKNWKIIENSKYAIPTDEARRLRRNRTLEPFDLVTPTRASKNIGLLGVIMPWQTGVVLTKEITVIRIGDSKRVTPWLVLVLMSLKVVNDQFRYLVQMQTNREDLGKRIYEMMLPIPRKRATRDRWQEHVRHYFDALVDAHAEYDQLLHSLDASSFVDRP